MEQTNNDGYDDFMDKECIELCNELNRLPGVKTSESCCGHCKQNYRIFFSSTNAYSLGVIARVFDRRYSGTNLVYNIFIITKDVKEFPQYQYMIESKSAYSSQEEMNEDVNTIIENIKYWKSSRFYKYFSDL